MREYKSWGGEGNTWSNPYVAQGVVTGVGLGKPTLTHWQFQRLADRTNFLYVDRN